MVGGPLGEHKKEQKRKIMAEEETKNKGFHKEPHPPPSNVLG